MTESPAVVNRQSKTTRVQQQILNLIAREDLTCGERLPPERELAEALDTSVITVRRAMADLVAHGVVERFQGRGTFVKRDLLESSVVVGHLAFVLVDRTTMFYEGIIEECREAVKRRNHRLLVVTTGLVPDDQALTQLAGVTGVLISGRVTDEWIAVLSAMHIPVVMVGSAALALPCRSVRCDYTAAACALVSLLHERGCRRIGLLNGARTYSGALDIHRGYLDGLRLCDLPASDNRVTWCRRDQRFADMAAFFATADCDGLMVESGCFQPLQLFLYERPELPARPLLGVISSRRITTEPVTRLVNMTFAERLGECAVDELFKANDDDPPPPRTVLIPPLPAAGQR